MPLDCQRLRDSAIVFRVKPEEFMAAVLLWAAAWHQVPASSLPDDDAELCRLAGYGRDLKAWKRIREGALWKFQKCSDGRLYHPVIAELAIGAWEYREDYRRRAEAARAAKAVKSALTSSVTDAVTGEVIGSLRHLNQTKPNKKDSSLSGGVGGFKPVERLSLEALQGFGIREGAK
jgi:hypothetical protein